MSSGPSIRSTGGFNRYSLLVIQAKMRTNPMPEATIHPMDEDAQRETQGEDLRRRGDLQR